MKNATMLKSPAGAGAGPRPVPFAVVCVLAAAVILGGFEASRAALADKFDSGATSMQQSTSPGMTGTSDASGGTDRGTGAGGEHSGTNTGGQ